MFKLLTSALLASGLVVVNLSGSTSTESAAVDGSGFELSNTTSSCCVADLPCCEDELPCCDDSQSDRTELIVAESVDAESADCCTDVLPCCCTVGLECCETDEACCDESHDLAAAIE